jgi:AraC-like DNA-binding protein
MEYKLLNLSQNKYTQHFLKDIYVLTNASEHHIYGCVPNGEIGISVLLNGDGYIRLGNIWQRQPPVSVYGLVSKVQFHQMAPGYREVNIGFLPEYLQLFIRERVSGLLRRQATDLYDILPEVEVQRLFTGLLSAVNDNDIVHIVGAFLERNLLYEQVDKRAQYCLNLIRSGTATNVDSLSQDMKISSTTLRHIFHHHVGITPKELIKILRVKTALLRQNITEENMTQTAYSLGYYDQSHFIHEFKEAVGLPPKQYFMSQELTFDFYNFQRWRYDSFAGLRIE